MLQVWRSYPRVRQLLASRSLASLVIKPRNGFLKQRSGEHAEITVPFRDEPRSLAIKIPSSSSDLHEVPPPGFKGYLLRFLGYYSQESKVIRGSRTLYDRIVERADDIEFYHALSLDKKFRTTYSILVLHMWLSLFRYRGEPDGKQAGQILYEIFYHDVEKRVAAAGVKVLISKWMKELEKNFYGAATAYDKALLPDASPDELSKALWRNVFAEDSSEMPPGEKSAQVEVLARYVRREVESLRMTDSKLFMRGAIRFSADFGHLS